MDELMDGLMDGWMDGLMCPKMPCLCLSFRRQDTAMMYFVERRLNVLNSPVMMMMMMMATTTTTTMIVAT